MSSTEVITVLDQIEDLPTLPVVAQQVLKLVAAPNSNMSQIAQIITKDQAIAAKVIRLTNSAFYGLRNRVSSIQHAIVILGLNTVKNLVLGVSVVKAFEDSARTSIFDREKFWLHSFSTALAAKLIAKATKSANEEDCFLAGLLHDIGILIIDQFLHDKFMEILQQITEKDTDFLSTEEEVLGMSHGDVGGFLAEKWKVNNFIIAAIKFHHIPLSLSSEFESHRDIVSVIHAADAKTRELNIGNFIDNFPSSQNESTIQKLDLSETELFEIGGQVREESNALMKEWGL